MTRAKIAHIQNANERKQILKGLQLLSLCKQYEWKVKPQFGWWGEETAPTYSTDTAEPVKRVGQTVGQAQDLQFRH